MREKRNFTLIALVIALVTVILISAYAMVRTNYDDDRYRISVVVENSGDEKWASFKAGAMDAASDYNVQLDFVNVTELEDIDEQMRVIEKEVQRGAQGIITEFVSSKGTAEYIKELSGKEVLQLVCSDAEADVDVEGKYAVIEPNNYYIGRAIGNEIILRHREDTNDLRVGIICGNQDKNSHSERYNGLKSILDQVGAGIIWEVSEDEYKDNKDAIRDMYKEKPVDVIACVDDEGLETAAETFLESNLIPEIYGEGCGVKNIFYLDRGKIVSMIVPDYFRMGYQSVTSVIDRINHKLTPMQDGTVDFKVINRESMFDEDNQKYLFTDVE